MKSVKHISTRFITAFLLMFLFSAAVSAEGFEKVNTMLNTVISGLHTIAIATATLAGLWVGFKVLFDGAALRDMKNVIIGAAIIIGIAEFIALVIS